MLRVWCMIRCVHRIFPFHEFQGYGLDFIRMVTIREPTKEMSYAVE